MPSINASPTKEFFISIITKDISLLDAIKDLVDNCVDGARSLRGDTSYDGLTVQIEVSPQHFLIVDNCGGIRVDTAANYAFRFGRAKGAPSVDRSIGQFGVGMKRALFKMGKSFEVQSVAVDSHFTLRVDVNEWTELVDDLGHEKWEFEFAESAEGESHPEASRGTTIEVSNLYPSVAAEFGTDLFVQNLISSLQAAHSDSLGKDLEIKVNSFELSHRIATLLVGADLRPIKFERTFTVDVDSDPTVVKLTIYAGVSESSLKDAGWYIICNGRQVLGADKTPLTGWDTEIEGGRKTPGAHGQFSRFRGYAIFESDSAKALPWNTSKSGVDTESPIYQSARMEMVNALRQVADFLNDLDAERDSESTNLKDQLDRAIPSRLSSLSVSSRFVAPTRTTTPTPARPTVVKVQFNRSVEDVDFAKIYFQVPSATKAGEAAFEYFLEREREE